MQTNDLLKHDCINRQLFDTVLSKSQYYRNEIISKDLRFRLHQE